MSLSVPANAGVKKKVNYHITGLDRPFGLQEFEAPRISKQSVYEGGRVVNFTHRPPLLPGVTPGTHFR